MIPSQQENQIIKWLLAESVSYINEAHPYFKNRLFVTHIHKLLFKLSEKYDLPLTRSWYRYGGFIHSEILMREEFSKFKEEPIFQKKLKYLRTELVKEGFPVEDILSGLYNEVDDFTTKELKEYIKEFYETAPKRYRAIYLTKFHLFYKLDAFTSILLAHRTIYFDDIYRLFSNFHKKAFILFDDENIEDIIINYTDVFESVLNKVECILESQRSLLRDQIKLIKSFAAIFDNYCWTPYACSISYETVTGSRYLIELRRILRRKQSSIEKAKEYFNDFFEQALKADLLLDFEEEFEIERSKDELSIEQAFDKLFKIYNRYFG